MDVIPHIKKDDKLTKSILKWIKQGKGQITSNRIVSLACENEHDAYTLYNKKKSAVRFRIKKLIKQGIIQEDRSEDGKIKLIVI